MAEPLYVRNVLQRSESVFAALQTAFGICLVLGGLIAAKLADRIASFAWIAIGVGGSGIAAIVYLGTPFVVVAFVGVGLWGVFTALIAGPSRTVLQRSSPERTHGRILSADFVTGSGAELAGVAAAGVLVGSLGVQVSMTGLGIAVALAAVVLLVSHQRRGADSEPVTIDPAEPVPSQTA